VREVKTQTVTLESYDKQLIGQVAAKKLDHLENWAIQRKSIKLRETIKEEKRGKTQPLNNIISWLYQRKIEEFELKEEFKKVVKGIFQDRPRNVCFFRAIRKFTYSWFMTLREKQLYDCLFFKKLKSQSKANKVEKAPFSW